MHQVAVAVPEPFLAVLDELVAQSQSGTREQWVKNVVRGILTDYQLKKNLAPQIQQTMNYFMTLWP